MLELKISLDVSRGLVIRPLYRISHRLGPGDLQHLPLLYLDLLGGLSIDLGRLRLIVRLIDFDKLWLITLLCFIILARGVRYFVSKVALFEEPFRPGIT